MSNTIKIISDNPAVKEVSFGFDAYAKTLTELIITKDNETPIVIGIYGEWGLRQDYFDEKSRTLSYKRKRL